jgi:hypothetical protein
MTDHGQKNMEGTTILFLAGLALTCGVLLFRTNRQLAARPKTALPSPASFSQASVAVKPGHRLDAPAEVRRWEVELHDLVRDAQAQLDTKIGILQQLVGDAQHQADRLEAALARASEVGQPSAHNEAGRQSPSDNPDTRVRLDKAAMYAGSLASRRHAEIYALADAGLSSAAIASRVGSPIGEIELILGLRGRDAG